MTVPHYDFQVTWADLDANGHLANAGFLNYASQSRFLYFESAGFPPSEFVRQQIGPAVLTDTITYRKELRHLERFRVSVLSGGANAKKTRFVIVNRFESPSGEECAVVRSMFVWFSRAHRRSVPTPGLLLAALENLPRDDTWDEL